MSRNIMFEVFTGLLIIVTIGLMLACSVDTVHQYDSKDLQDQSCFGSYKGTYGYCDK